MTSPSTRQATRLAYSPAEASAALGVSRDFFDEHIACELRCIRRGRRKLFPLTELHRWLGANALLPLGDER